MKLHTDHADDRHRKRKEARRNTIWRDGQREHGSTVRVPRNALAGLGTPIGGPTHDPAAGVPAPHHGAGRVGHEAERGRRGPLPERRARFVPEPARSRRRAEGVREVPDPDAGLARRPEVGGGAGGRSGVAGESAEGGAGL